jgi:thiol-disulfide isomerase/thioredoxin
MTTFTCPHCHAVLKANQALSPGQRITCPKCAQEFNVTEVAVPPAPPEAEAQTQTFPGGAPPAPAPPAPRITAEPVGSVTLPERPRPRSRPRRKRKRPLLVLGAVLVSLLAVVGAVVGALAWVYNLADKTPKSDSLAEMLRAAGPEAKPQPPPAQPVVSMPPPPPDPGPVGENVPEPPGPPEKPREPRYPDGTPWVGLAVGNRALDIDGEDLDGQRFRLSDYRGKVVCVDFWADWCVYCRRMFDHEKSLQQRLQGKPFALLGVNCDNTKPVAKRSVEKNGLTWRSWWDGPPTGSPICAQWGVTGYPRIFVLDHQGVIRYQQTGLPQNLKDVDTVIEKLVADLEREPKGKEAPKKDSPK